DGFNMRNDVDAGGQLTFNERMGDAPRLFERTAGCEDESLVGHKKLSIQRLSVEAYEGLGRQGKSTLRPRVVGKAIGSSICRSWFLPSFKRDFLLTPEVKAKLTEKLRRDPAETLGIKVA